MVRPVTMQEVAAEYYAFASTNDFTPIIVKFKQLNPDVVFHIARGNELDPQA